MLLAVFAAWGSDLPMRRHAKESRPVFHQGRSMSVIFPHSLPETVWLIGTVECPTAMDRAPSARRACVGCFRRFETVLDRALITMLMLAFGAGAAIAAAPQSLSIDLSHQQIGSPLNDNSG
jgi:hypothetical protein